MEPTVRFEVTYQAVQLALPLTSFGTIFAGNLQLLDRVFYYYYGLTDWEVYNFAATRTKVFFLEPLGDASFTENIPATGKRNRLVKYSKVYGTLNFAEFVLVLE